jgi:hypothetical protein
MSNGKYDGVPAPPAQASGSTPAWMLARSQTSRGW